VQKTFAKMDKINREDNQKARQALLKMGTEFARPEDSEITYWKRLADEVIQETGSEAASPELYKKLKDLLAKQRSKN
jgi:hypothetical protein